jgi:hypothetical protein
LAVYIRKIGDANNKISNINRTVEEKQQRLKGTKGSIFKKKEKVKGDEQGVKEKGTL